jgi:hypothetical protein
MKTARENSMHHTIRHSLIALTCGLAACTSELELGSVVHKAGSECDIAGCGLNNPKIASYPATPIRSTPGAASPSGFVSDGFSLGGDAMQFEIHEGELIAIDAAGNQYGGDLVEGGNILLQYGSSKFMLHIVDHRLVEYWTRPGEYVHMYRMSWVDAVSGRVGELCTNPPPSWELEWTGIGHHAFFVGGESYDVPSISVAETGGGSADIVNIACAGSGLAKTELNSYTANIPAAGAHATSPVERATLLRVYAAAYCYDDTTGPGDTLTRYTKPGVPLQIEDSRGWMIADLAVASAVEAVWSEDGVICLETPRRPDQVTDLGLDCAPPSCTDLGFDDPTSDVWKMAGTFRTLVP